MYSESGLQVPKQSMVVGETVNLVMRINKSPKLSQLNDHVQGIITWSANRTKK